MRGADILVRGLIQHEVEHIFGVPGDTSMYFYSALERYAGDITHILCRDERSASYMADAYARIKGKPGLVEVPSGGGVLYAVPGVSEANESSIPLICLSSDISLSSDETGALTSLNQEALFSPLTKWNSKVKLASKIPGLLNKAFRVATGGRPGAVHLAIPENIYAEECDFTPDNREHAISFRNEPNAEDITACIDLIKGAQRPLVLAGGGVHLASAYDELKILSEMLQIPVATTINGKGSVSEFAAYSLGVIGANGGLPETNQIVKEADLILVLGSKLNNVTTVGGTLVAKECALIQVDMAEERLNMNHDSTLAIMGDIKFFLKKLIDFIKNDGGVPKNSPWRDRIMEANKAKRKRIESKVHVEGEKVNPAKLFSWLEQLTDNNTIFAADAGTPTPYLASYLRIKKPGRYSVVPRAHGSLGYALPASMGAQIAAPGSPVISIFGDGSFGMSVGELETAKRLRLPVLFIHLQNHCYGWIKTLQQLYYCQKYYSVDFSSIDCLRIAEGFGIPGIKIDRNSMLEEGLKWALAKRGPVFLDVHIDPPTDLIPPVCKWEDDAQKREEERVKQTY